MSDPSLPGTPGTGPTPEPEPEGFRDAQIEAEYARARDEAVADHEASKEAYETHTGKEYPYDAPPDPPVTARAKSTSHDTKSKSSPQHSSKSDS